MFYQIKTYNPVQYFIGAACFATNQYFNDPWRFDVFNWSRGLLLMAQSRFVFALKLFIEVTGIFMNIGPVAPFKAVWREKSTNLMLAFGIPSVMLFRMHSPQTRKRCNLRMKLERESLALTDKLTEARSRVCTNAKLCFSSVI